jgi:hypothetical protein
MPIPVVCACSAKLKVADHLLDLDVRCPKCGTVQPAAAPAAGSPYYHLYAATPRGPAPPRADAPVDLPDAPPLSPEEVLARSPLSEAEKRALAAELEDDERLVWAGKPDPALAFRRTLMISGGLVFGGLFMWVIGGVIFYLESSQGRDLGTFGLAAEAILGVLGLGLVAAAVGLPVFNRWRCGRNVYAVTSRRAIVFDVSPLGGLKPITYTPAELHGFHRRDLNDSGAGDLVFKTRVFQFNTDQRGGQTQTIVLRYGFLNLRRSAEVEKIVRETLVDPLLDKIYE